MPRVSKKAKAAQEAESTTEKTGRISDYDLPFGIPDLDDIDIESNFPTSLPLLPIRDQVYFPHMIFPLLVGREKSVRALEEAAAQDRHILIVTQKNIHVEEPGPEDLYDVGIVVEIMQVLRIPDGTVRVMLEGLERCRIVKFQQTEPYYRVEVAPVPIEEKKDIEHEALMRNVMSQFEHIVNISKNIQPEALINVMNTEEPGRLADVITPYLRQMRVEAQQEILEMTDVGERLRALSLVLKKESEILELQRNIRTRVEKEMGDTQREFFLREQLKVIQQELGERDETSSEMENYRLKIAEAKMPTTVEERALKEVGRLEKMPFAAPEGGVIRNYLDWLTCLPWSVKTEDSIDVEEAAAVLDYDHYG